MSIREKVYELLEAVESSAEILNANLTDWESRKLDREAGQFIPDEVTDPLNLDRNRIDNSLPMTVSDGRPHYDDTETQNSGNTEVVDGATVMIGVEDEEEHPDTCECPECKKKAAEAYKYKYGESSFAADVNKLLKESESDVAGIKKYNIDGRIAAYEVKNALNKVLPETASTGLQVIEEPYGNRAEKKMYTVTGYGDAKLPKELDVEVDAETMATLYLGKRSAEEPEAHHYFLIEPEYK
jgi:hypothetical protein